jgi:thymidylate synthase
MGPDYHESDGIDQVRGVIDGLRKNPWDRRALVVAWNPLALREMALPPCHVLFQFFGIPDKEGNPELHCMFYQRSCDVGLGVPFNIASYALLTHLVAHVLGWGVGTLVHAMGDVHIYQNHCDALREQTLRLPRKFPKLVIECERKGDPRDYEMSDVKLIDYYPHGNLSMKMAV